jgi:ATP-dependent Clp protease ATP-binding subunit ClpB
VILFDEIEKAHPDVFNTLLQVLDDGRLTDGQGRTVDFKNTVVILTSNVGSAELALIEERRDLDEEKMDKALHDTAMAALRQQFRPEFLNRLDEIVVYRRLRRDQIRSIVDIQLGYLAAQLAERELKLELEPEAKDYLAQHGWDPQFGARPLKRAIQRHLEDPLAERLLAGDFRPGASVHVSVADGQLKFREEAAGAGSGDAARESGAPGARASA